MGRLRRFLAVTVAAVFACGAGAVARDRVPSPLAQLRWRSIGPAVSGGRLGAVAGTNRDPYLYYVGAAGGGVWKSTNAGQTWSPVFDAEDDASIGAIAIDPQNTNVVWVGTGEAAPRNDVIEGDGVYLTRDGGKTWRHVLVLPDTLVSKILIDPVDPQRILVGVLGDPFAASPQRGVYRTTDGGKTWNKTLYLAPDTGVSDMADAAKAPGVVYAGLWEFRRTGWSLRSGGPHDGLYESTDFGATWAKLAGHGLPSGEEGRIGIAVAASNPKRVYALIQSKEGLLWRSDDAGASWRMVSDNTLIDERPFYYTHVFVDPTNENQLWALSVHNTVSIDGGKTFRITARGVHGDNHSMWIASDGKRIIEGNDGGIAFSNDGGTTWTWDNALPISQLYHVGYDRRNPYRVCAPLQDNGVWCAPSNPLDPRGVSSSQWRYVGGGDGTWALPDPLDPHLIWTSSAGGNYQADIAITDTRTDSVRSIPPYMRDQNAVDPKYLRYRFNWEAPIAFDPFDPHLAYYGGNVLFATSDRGSHWRVLGPDLTRDDRAHQVVTGGITLDGTGAETSDTILYIAPSHVRRGEIWIGTDDGLVQITRDGGKHWKNVTPPGLEPWGRFASLSASPQDAGTLYAAYDRHMAGDFTPHLYVTHDFGRRWRSIAHGLPAGQPVRSVRVDPRSPSVIYAGLEESLWVSLDGGEHWQNFNQNLPAASIRDIRVQPDTHDLILATHGRGVWILDDAAPVAHLAHLLATLSHGAIAHSVPTLFPVRPAYEWNEHRYWNTPSDGKGPPYGAIVTFWLNRPAARVSADVRDASGRVVWIAPRVTGQAGMNRFVWNLRSAKPRAWKFAPAWNNYYDAGPPVLPGTYTVEVRAGALTLRAPVIVKQDPRTRWTAAQLKARYVMERELYGDYGRVDRALNLLGTVVREAPLRVRALRRPGDGSTALAVAQAAAAAKVLMASITSNPGNDQDNDFLQDMLRERLQTQIDASGGTFAPPTQAQARETAVLHALANERVDAVRRFSADGLRSVDARLRAAKVPPLTHLTGKPAIHKPNG